MLHNYTYYLAVGVAFTAGCMLGVIGGYCFLHDEMERRYVPPLNDYMSQAAELREQVRQLSKVGK